MISRVSFAFEKSEVTVEEIKSLFFSKTGLELNVGECTENSYLLSCKQFKEDVELEFGDDVYLYFYSGASKYFQTALIQIMLDLGAESEGLNFQGFIDKKWEEVPFWKKVIMK